MLQLSGLNNLNPWPWNWSPQQTTNCNTLSRQNTRGEFVSRKENNLKFTFSANNSSFSFRLPTIHSHRTEGYKNKENQLCRVSGRNGCQFTVAVGLLPSESNGPAINGGKKVQIFFSNYCQRAPEESFTFFVVIKHFLLL